MAKTATPESVSNNGLPNFDELLPTVQEVIQSQLQVSTKSGENAALIKNTCEKNNYHRGAFKDLVKIMKMADDKREDYLRTFLDGLDMIMDDIGLVREDLFAYAERQEEDGNVTTLQPAAE